MTIDIDELRRLVAQSKEKSDVYYRSHISDPNRYFIYAEHAGAFDAMRDAATDALPELLSTIESQAARIKELESEREWRTIDSAPKDGTLVLVRNSLGTVHVARWGKRYLGTGGQLSWFTDDKYVGGVVTHWQPLPPAPKG